MYDVADQKSFDKLDIWIEDGLIRSSIGALRPISENEIVIVGGAFDGETIEYDPESGSLYHQGFAYAPAEPSSDGGM